MCITYWCLATNKFFLHFCHFTFKIGHIFGIFNFGWDLVQLFSDREFKDIVINSKANLFLFNKILKLL